MLAEARDEAVREDSMDVPSIACTGQGDISGSTATEASGELPLLDLSHYEGLPKQGVSNLLAMYYGSAGKAGTAFEQLLALEQDFDSGLHISDSRIAHKLHQLAGSSLQAGAYRLGHRIKGFKEEPPTDIRIEIEHMRTLIKSSAEEARAKGFLL